MRLLWLVVAAAGAVVVSGEPGKIIVDDKVKKSPDDVKKWKPYVPSLYREERVHGEVLVLSPPLFVRGPPKGFPFRKRVVREAGLGRSTGRQNRIPDSGWGWGPDRSHEYRHEQRHEHRHEQRPSERVQGEVVVHSSPLSITGPPKGFPLRRKTRDVTSTEGRKSAGGVLKKKTDSNSNSAKETRKQQGLRPPKGRKSLMKRLKKMWPYFLIPTMMTLGYAPFVLSSLKMFVMNALMINMMAFNAAIFLTLRNMVFGPRLGGHTKYHNFGYQHRNWNGHDNRR